MTWKPYASYKTNIQTALVRIGPRGSAKLTVSSINIIYWNAFEVVKEPNYSGVGNKQTSKATNNSNNIFFIPLSKLSYGCTITSAMNVLLDVSAVGDLLFYHICGMIVLQRLTFAPHFAIQLYSVCNHQSTLTLSLAGLRVPFAIHSVNILILIGINGFIKSL